MRLDISYKENKKKKTVRKTNTWRLNDAFLNNQQVTEKTKKEIKKKFWKLMIMKTCQLKTYETQQK